MGQINQSSGNAICLAGDVGDEDYNKALVDLAENTYGNLDAAFNNAGIMGDQVPVPDMDAANWDAVMKTNLTSAFYASKHQISAMKRNGGGSVTFYL
ncbi:SDR family NAD(P)-dependent oxidoreductase [Epibacterium ulvae]|uniref:SDR family NAD(P)-dependent oxidoreductase n=1 Tax=Epibacterium ulvae TaxID=1156985 RepID=UPI002491616E|nr:SDR family NAD(P)-dependent oxidoreductase [Epibacterium ulvae]